MKVFPHGYVVNFQESAREMYPKDLDAKLKIAISQCENLMVGTISIPKQELHVFGTAESFDVLEEQDLVHIRFRRQDGETEEREHPLSALIISHEARFDIQDPAKGTVPYTVLYVTFVDGEDTDEEITYFFTNPEAVTHPLDCVAEFWMQVHEVGRDVDFDEVGCAANLWKPNRTPPCAGGE
jgi:hypothetical protein